MILTFRNVDGINITIECAEGYNLVRDRFLASAFFGINPAIRAPIKTLCIDGHRIDVTSEHFCMFGKLLYGCISGQYNHLTYFEQLLVWGDDDKLLSPRQLLSYWLNVIRAVI